MKLPVKVCRLSVLPKKSLVFLSSLKLFMTCLNVYDVYDY